MTLANFLTSASDPILVTTLNLETGVKWVAEPPGDLERVKAGGLDPKGERARILDFAPFG